MSDNNLAKHASSERHVRVGLLGCGAVARLHAERLVADGRAEIVVCCDPHLANAQQLQAQFAPRAAVEEEALPALDRHELDAVVICSPTLSHYEQVCLALERGMHVLCEKPLAPERDQILDLMARQQTAQRVLSVSYQRRYKAAYRTARRELLERPDFYGPLQQVHVFACERWRQTIAGTWRDDPGVAFGYFGDAGTHQIDVACYITGCLPRAVLAHSDRRGCRVEVVTQVTARLSQGVGLSAHYVGDANHWREDIHFHCRDADLLLRSEQLSRCRENVVEPITDLVRASNPDEALLDEILLGIPSASRAADALPVHDWTEAILQSLREKTWIELPG